MLQDEKLSRILVLSLVTWLVGGYLFAQAVPVLLVRNDGPEGARIEKYQTVPIDLPKGRSALAVWMTEGGEHWEVISGRWVPAVSPISTEDRALGRFSRGGDLGGGPEGNETLTTQLEQVIGLAVVRGGQLVSPQDGLRILLGRPVFLRSRRKPGEHMPPLDVRVFRNDKEMLHCTFKEDQDRLNWEDIAPNKALRQGGLPPGDYKVKLKTALGPQEIVFRVALEQERKRVLDRAERLARLLDGPEKILGKQVAIETLLSHRDTEGRLRPYAVDALALLQEIPERERTAYMRRLEAHLVESLTTGGVPRLHAGWVAPAPTGVVEIDAVRVSVLAGEWDKALRSLDSIQIPTGAAGRRVQGMVALYKAAIHAEAGVTGSDKAVPCFEQAMVLLSESNPKDRFRVHNNYAGYLLTRSRERLYNQSLAQASGGVGTLSRVLEDWEQARQQLKQAERMASVDQRPVLEANRALLHVVLSDVFRSQREAKRGEAYLGQEEESLIRLARASCTKLTGEKSEVKTASDDGLLATVWLTQAQLSLRAGEIAGAIAGGEKAVSLFLRDGMLPGLEASHRLLGVAWRRHGEGKKALRHYEIAHHLAEVLRERYPPDRIGVGRAGFLARRAYVFEQMVELLIEQGKDAEALQVAELGKARSLQDLLSVAGRKMGQPDDTFIGGGLLGRWPKDVVALEYFLGGNGAWVFCVDTSGKVKAHPLRGRDGRSIQSRDLIGRVQRFLRDTGHQAVKMRHRLLAGKGFDHGWQDVLHEFHQDLLPDAVRKEMAKARTVVIAPQHVLHYFPFAALVTTRDERKRAASEMVQPRFLVEESFDLSCVPSLAVWERLRGRPARAIEEVNAVGIVEVPGAPVLEGVEQEMKHLRTAFGKKVRKIYEGQEGHRDNVRKLLGRPGLLLIATHGQNHPDRPLESYLMLYPREGDDGLLTAGQLYEMETKADVVVLNACYSGLGDRSPLPGDDLFGLQRALLQAGARSVVAGMWDIYDGTGPLLMEGVFRRLAKGQGVASSLAQAQREFVKASRATADDPWIHPYFWAVYAPVGG